MPGKEHPIIALQQALDEANRQSLNTSKAIPERPAQVGQSPVSQAGQGRKMRLPPILIDTAAKDIFEYWETHAAHKQGVKPVAWAELHPEYQRLWREIVSDILEMGISVVLKDAIHVLDVSNGDMGGAFAKALRRYMRERLDI